MLIGIDGNEANTGQKVGIGQYAYQLIWHLYKLQLTHQNPGINFRIYLKDNPRKDLPKETSWWKYNVFGPKFFWTQVALPGHLYLERIRPEVFFTPTHYSPRFSPVKRVISVMDLSFIFFPEMFQKKDLYQLRSWTAYSVYSATKIFTISDYSKKSIVDYYHIPQEKVIVTYPGYDKEKFKQPTVSCSFPINRLKGKYKISGDYIFFVGTLQPRKNITNLMEAFKLLKKRKKQILLVIAGKKGWLYGQIFEKVKELSLEKEVIFTDYISDEELPYFYQGAKCFVLPSLYEGFGIPVIEAMACGCPVVTSNVSSLPEIVGKAGILVNPENIKEMAEGIYQACFDEQKRSELIKAGFKRALLFDWEKCAESTLETLKREIG